MTYALNQIGLHGTHIYITGLKRVANDDLSERSLMELAVVDGDI